MRPAQHFFQALSSGVLEAYLGSFQMIYDRGFLRKWLTTFDCQLFFEKNSIIDFCQAPKYAYVKNGITRTQIV